jgi:HupE / UreJ protein
VTGARSRRLAAALLAALPAAGLAHELGLSHGSYALEGDRLEVTLRFSTADLAAGWPALAAPVERLRAEVPDALARAIAGTVAAARESGPCGLEAASGRPEASDGARFSLAFRCPGAREAVRLGLGFVARMPPGHLHLARAASGGAEQQHVVDARDGGFTVEARVAWWPTTARYVALGIEHILTGWDHLAFLVGLLLAGGGLRALVRTVTSFTVGHAITLTLATAGAVSPPSSLVEPLIAASVVAVAVDNLRPLRRGTAGLGRGWPLALAFGLVHGFGFAGALAELGLPRAGLATALASFNLGVELGQAAVVGLVFPALALLRRSPLFERRFLPAASTLVGGAGLVWLAQRLGG